MGISPTIPKNTIRPVPANLVSGCLVVAGIARSGLSVTMQMLYAGGYPCKGQWPAFECFQVGNIPWGECASHAVKLVDAQLQLPPEGEYRVIRLRRNMTQQAKSFKKLVGALSGLHGLDQAKLIRSFQRDYKLIDSWAERYPVLTIDFERIITEPIAIATEIKDFVGSPLDVDQMASCVVNRGTDCHPTLLEAEMI